MRIWKGAVATVFGLMLSVGLQAQEQREIRYEQCVRVIEAMVSEDLPALNAEVTPEVHAQMTSTDIRSLIGQIKAILPNLGDDIPPIEEMTTFYVTKETDAGFEEMENYAFIYGEWVLYFVYTESGGEKITGYNLTLKENIRSLN
ncbi:MAG: hypothetical protein HWD92_02255 [Flavobacteriia bacterium]|nr:hypothetical protein [Flavobacteriia bacterium]